MEVYNILQEFTKKLKEYEGIAKELDWETELRVKLRGKGKYKHINISRNWDDTSAYGKVIDDTGPTLNEVLEALEFKLVFKKESIVYPNKIERIEGLLREIGYRKQGAKELKSSFPCTLHYYRNTAIGPGLLLELNHQEVKENDLHLPLITLYVYLKPEKEIRKDQYTILMGLNTVIEKIILYNKIKILK